MILAVVRRAKGEDLAFRACRRAGAARAKRASTSGRSRFLDTASIEHGCGAFAAIQDPQRRQQPGQRGQARARPQPLRARLSGSGRSGPIGARSKSCAGSASVSAASASSQRSRAISTGCAGIGGIALVRERQRGGPPSADEQRRLRLRDRQARAMPGVAVSIEANASGWRPSILTARPVRSAAIARSTGPARFKWRPRRSAAHGPTAAPSSGTARAPGARGRARRRPARPTYGRAAGRGRSWSSRASDSSTR